MNNVINVVHSWILEGVSEGIQISILTILLVLLEHKFGLLMKLKKIFHRVINSKSPIILNITYDTNINFDELKQIIKNFFNEEYKDIKVFKTKGTLEFNVDKSFNITVYDNTNNEISILTSKLPTTMWTVKKEIRKVFDVLKKIKKHLEQDVKGTNKFFNEKEFSIRIFLPYKNCYMKLYPPKNVDIKKYDIQFIHKDFPSIIEIKGDIINIHSSHQSNIEQIIRKII